jgi:RHH-type rel operon transcriptional repressor/antitoxin RelB
MSTTLTIRLESDLKDRLDDLAIATKRSKSFLAAEAIQEFVALNEWQLQEIKTALAEADVGDFASEKELRKTLGKWGVDAD